MTRYLLTVNYDGGIFDIPMDQWAPEDAMAHMDYYRVLNEQLTESGELVGGIALTSPEVAKIVTAGEAGRTPVVTDGPYAEFKEWLAGYQIIDVESEERALEIAAMVSRVPGPGGVPTEQPIGVRRVMDDADVAAMLPEM
ncbi:YciI family protein [Streptomyces sp. NPDC051940]|uniref:YciI family protein n=1 Tax=Streptomyces sp. NPDC051940 TaxID=3155675 RepID=UPI00343E8846